MDQTRTFLLGQMAGAKTLQDYHLAFLALRNLEQLLAQRVQAQGLGQSYPDPLQTVYSSQPMDVHDKRISTMPRTRPAPQPSQSSSHFVAQPLPPEFTRPVQVRDEVAPDFDSIEVPGEEWTYNP